MPHDDLAAELALVYRAAGRPSFRRISAEIRGRDDMPDTVSHETVSALLSGVAIPRWSKVECVVRQLAEMAVHHPDPDAEVRRFHALWLAHADADRRAPEPAPVPDVDPPPAAEPSNGSIPPRNPGFTGRADLLEVMRSRLDDEPWQPLILHGLGGAGKTSVALEFVHRQLHRFDLVWWIVAEQPARTRAGLVALGERLPLEVELSRSDMRQAVNIVLGELERPGFTWLLVYDNAAGPDQILDLLPVGRGAVIVTTRDASWTRYGRTVVVDVLPRKDSIELLQSRGPISFDDADRLADRLGDLPLALEQAAAMRAATGTSVRAYLEQLDGHATSLLSKGRPRDSPETVAGAFGLTFSEVRRESPAAAQLLGMLSCLSAEPISLALLRTADERDIAPPLGRLLRQDSQFEAAVSLLERFGLLTTVDSGQKVQVHRLVHLIVRDSMTGPERTAAYRNARRLLVAANPGQPDEPLTWEMHAQIGPHIGPAGALDDLDPRVRRVVLDHVRYLYVLGDFDGSLRLSAEARAAWAGPDDVWNDEETFACIDQYALALVGLGRYREASELYEQAWVRLNAHKDFGSHHSQTVRTATGVAMASRILGGYGKALDLERYRVDHYLRSGDREQPEMLRARRNQALSYRAIGDYGKAAEIDESLVDHWRRSHGDTDYRTQLAVSDLARDLYGLGRYRTALDLQRTSLVVLRDRLNSRHPEVVLAGRTVAIALRKTGEIAEALRWSRDHFLTCQGEWGSDHGHTLAAAMTYANALRVAAAAGQGGGLTYSHAYNTSLRAVNTYRARFGETNPLTLAAATNHAITLRAMGERTIARRTGESAYHLLLDQLGAAHPYTQAAAVGLANDLATQHDDGGAARLLRNTLEAARSAGRDRHPDMLVCALNLGFVSRTADPAAGQGFAAHLEALRDELGAQHLQVLAAERGERGDCDIEPPPL